MAAGCVLDCTVERPNYLFLIAAGVFFFAAVYRPTVLPNNSLVVLGLRDPQRARVTR